VSSPPSVAVEVSNVSKRFKLSSLKTTSIKERLLRLDRSERHREFWALHELSFTVAQGETLGMLGHNGSGKSTLLKCIAGIIKPTTGEIRVRGRIASLLELGAGFHPDLTGRENVYINASFLGISQKEIGRHFDEIVAFAELEPFIDQQVKYYSSGMFVRLGFAVATNVDPDILLIDEVLAVGDEVFQKKCLDRIARFQEDGRTILFVTHDAELVRRICNTAVVLDHGHLVAHAAPGDAVRVYRDHLHGHLTGAEEAPDDHEAARDRRVKLTDVRFEHPGTGTRPYLYAGEPLTVRVGYEAVEEVPDVVVGLTVHGQEHPVLVTDTDRLGVPISVLEGRGEIVFRFEAVPLTDGAFPLSIRLQDRSDGRLLDWRDREDAFEVANPTRSDGSHYLPCTVEVRSEG
jgi:ABC-2 type transport system ATP-binding protein